MKWLKKIVAGPLQEEAGDIEAMGNARRALEHALQMPLKATGKKLDEERYVYDYLAEMHDELVEEIKKKSAAWKRSTIRKV